MIFSRATNGVKSGDEVNEVNIAVALASYWLMGGKPRINSIVRSIPDVEYIVWSTDFRFVYGLMSNAIDRCASTWSGPFWASSSRTNIADSFQYLLCEMRSTIIPSPRSLSATIALGESNPFFVPAV